MYAIRSYYAFEIGDFVVIGTDKGVIEKIGLKTTRIRSLQGEEIVVSNKELTSVRVQNFKKMKERRISFQIGRRLLVTLDGRIGGGDDLAQNVGRLHGIRSHGGDSLLRAIQPRTRDHLHGAGDLLCRLDSRNNFV